MNSPSVTFSGALDSFRCTRTDSRAPVSLGDRCHPMMRPKRTCTTADTASAAPAKRVRRGAAGGAVSTGNAATRVEEHGAGSAAPCVQVTTSRHVKGAAANSLCQTEGVAVASPCGRQAGPAGLNSEQAPEPSARGGTAACSAPRASPGLPAAERGPGHAVAAAPLASSAAADAPPSSARTAAEADKAGDTESGMDGGADLTERLRSAARSFEERHAGYSRLYECASLPATSSSPSPVV